MSRAGGSATLSGVEYQVLYTASRFAEAITEDGILSLRPEAHHAELPTPTDGLPNPTALQRSAVDDLLVTHRSKPTEYISLKYRDSNGSWDVKQLTDRKIIHDFFRQHQQDSAARLLLVSQSPINRDLDDCIERVNTSVLSSLEADLGAGPYQVFKVIETYLQQGFASANPSRSDTLRFLRQVELYAFPAPLLSENLLLRLQPRVADATAAKNSLTALALRAGAAQLRLTPDLIRQELIQQGQPLILPPAFADVMAQLRQASSSLTSEPYTIGHLPAHHIIRPEIAELLSWVLNPLPPFQQGESAASQKSKILIGGAGVGKTVLARALCLTLQNENVPVLGLKADRVKGSTKGELLSQIQRDGLHYPLKQAIMAVASAERPAVVIIDQLDALSMCLSTDHGQLKSYTELLAELYDLPYIRFIFSCRTFDLQHDVDLAPFRQAQRVEVPLLSLSQVEEALRVTQAAPNLSGLSGVLQELLRVPLHLAIYCAFDDAARRQKSITSLQGLYGRLFDDFLVRRNRLPEGMKSKRIKRYLTSLAVAMHTGQTLTLPRFNCREQDVEVFEYLCSRGILIATGISNQQVALFHQSFFEYLFARQFAVSGQSLAAFVLSSGQGLFQRSLIQQVLVYLRGIDSPEYLQALQKLLGSQAYRFHIRLLLTQQVASQQEPAAEEFTIVQELILSNKALGLSFLEAITARPWFTWLVSPAVFRLLLPESVAPDDTAMGRALFWRLTNYAPDLALEQVDALPSNIHKTAWLTAVLPYVKAREHRLFIPLFEELFTAEIPQNQQFIFWQILQKAARYQPEWTATKMYEQLADWPNASRAHIEHEAHFQVEVFEKLYTAAPAVCFSLCSKLLRSWIKKANNYREPHYRNWKSKYTLLPSPYFLEWDSTDKDDPRNASDAVQHYVWKYLVEQASAFTAKDYQTVVKWLNSRTKILVSAALAAVAANPTPFTNALVALFVKPGWLAETAYRGIGYYVLTVFPMVWDTASFDQRRLLADILISRMTMVDEVIRVYDGQRKVHSRFGRATLRYLLALTPDRLADFPELLQLYHELLRRWGNIPNKMTGVGIKATDSYPSPAETWKTSALTANDWLKALRKYRDKERPFHSEEGTYEGLVQQLSGLLKESPIYWESILCYLIEHKDKSVATLLPIFSDVAFELAQPLIDRAFQLDLLTHEEIRYIRRTTRIGADGKKRKADPEDIRADLAKVRDNLTTPPTVSGDKVELIIYALNSPGGNAISNLLQEKLPDEVIPEVLDTLQLVATEGSRYVRAGAAYHVAMLLNAQVPPKDIVALFIALIGNDYELMEPGLWSLQYLVWRDYDAILILCRRAIGEEKAHKPIAKILTVMWANNRPGAYEVLTELWAINFDMRATSLKMLTDGYNDWPDKQIFYDAFEMFLVLAPTEKLRRAYDSIFIHFPSADFERIAPLIPLYLNNCAADFDRDHFIIDYLAKSVRNHPSACVAALTTLFSQLPVTQNYWPAKRALQVLIEAYTALPHHVADDTDSKAALDLFDNLLARPDCREELDKTLEQVQSTR
jgi:hypothetical protein